MKSVYPVSYERKDRSEQSTYFIVAQNSEQAEEIAYFCIANDPPPPEQGERPASYGRTIAQAWVRDHWAQPTETDCVGPIGTGSESLLAKALALYVEKRSRVGSRRPSFDGCDWSAGADPTRHQTSDRRSRRPISSRLANGSANGAPMVQPQ